MLRSLVFACFLAAGATAPVGTAQAAVLPAGASLGTDAGAVTPVHYYGYGYGYNYYQPYYRHNYYRPYYRSYNYYPNYYYRPHRFHWWYRGY